MKQLTVRRPSTYVRQGPVPDFDRQTPVTQDEVLDLLCHRNVLLEEKRLLLARIARVDKQNKRGGRPASANQQLSRELNKEVKALEKAVAEKKRIIAELNLSDRAAQCRELEEDAKIVFQDRLRLRDLQSEREQTLEECEKRLDQLIEAEGPALIPEQEETIKALEEKLEKYRHANQKLKQRLEGQEKMEGKVAERIGELERQIEEVREATEKNRGRIEEERLKHSEAIEKLRRGG
jgi:chromosome segregation ATPase